VPLSFVRPVGAFSALMSLSSALAWSLAAAAVCGVPLACSRTPPEPEPLATASPANGAASAVAPRAASPARCIAETPSEAPPIPPPAPEAACPPDPGPPQALPTAEVAFPDAPGRPRVEVEIVKTPADIQRGLMYRRSLPESGGMLFRMERRREQTFWMQNTCIPLDMLFVDDDGTIVGIVEGAEPLTETTRSVGCPSSWVLEVNGGWTRQNGVRAGQKMGIPAAAR
jgi:uncharacterized protein